MEQEDEEEAEKEDTSGPDYNYLLSMPMWFLTKEKKEELCKQRDAKVRCSVMPSKKSFKFNLVCLMQTLPISDLTAVFIDYRAERPEKEESSRHVEGRPGCFL